MTDLTTSTAPGPAQPREITARGDAPVERRTAAALRAWCEHQDMRARDEVVRRYMPLAIRLARKYAHPTGEPFDDLVQVAMLGLVKAVDRFDGERGFAFSSFATPTILGELRRHFRDHTRIVHVARGLQEDVLLVERAMATHASRTAPTPIQLAEQTGISEERVVEALMTMRTSTPRSLDAPTGADDSDDPASLGDRCGTVDPGFERIDELASAAPVVATFSDRDRTILRLRFVDDLTQTEIADRVGISQMQVSRILARCTRELRAARASA